MASTEKPMRIVETYSHYNGLEFLEIHRHDLLEELKQLVKAFDISGVGNAGLSSRVSSFRNDPQSRRYHEQLESRGWHNSNSWRIENFSKQRIALKFCFGVRAGEERLEFNEFCARYRCDEIDVGIGIFPISSAEQDPDSCNFGTAIQNLGKSSRAGVVVPLALFAVGPETDN